jgi:quercetin 2,3-dioxygenase
MITLRRSADRGYADHGWLKSFHSFSFAGYMDPEHMGIGNLRVINEDRVAAGQGFGTHSHQDMEIVSYVLEGELAHADSMGNGTPGAAHTGIIRPGDVQRMSAGTGVRHSEFNHSKDEVTHFLQVWVLPCRTGIAPSYEQKSFDDASKRGQLRLVASPDGHDGSVTLHADASIRAGLFDGDESAQLAIESGRLTYVQVVRGAIDVNGLRLATGDAAKLSNETALKLTHGEKAEVLVFDLAT